MALRAVAGLRGRPALALTPGLRQSIGLLRMSAAELAEAAARLAAENPFVVLLPPRADSDEARLRALPDRPGPVEALHRQLALQPLEPAVRRAAEYLAGCLDEAGYLEAPLAEIAAEAGLPLPLAEAGLAAVQACEPAGIGARDLAECLLLQLLDRGWPRDVAARLVGALDAARRGGVAGLAAALGLSPAEAARAWTALRALAPRPLDPGAPPASLRPDLVAEPTPRGFRVRLVRGGMPRLRLDAALAARARAAGFGAEARAAAEAFLAGLRFRGRTLLRLGTYLAEAQHRMLTEGRAAQRPLTRAAAAAALGLHPATVGRAVAGKAMLVEGRLWPLASFFSPAVPGAETPVAAAAARHALARLVAAEAPERPLSDAELALRLAAEGVDIARRTVAKYRSDLRIPAATARRRPLAPAAASAGVAADRAKPPPASARAAAAPTEQEDS